MKQTRSMNKLIFNHSREYFLGINLPAMDIAERFYLICLKRTGSGGDQEPLCRLKCVQG